MGFARKSNREAQAAQVAALNQQNAILAQQQAAASAYRDGYATRNAGITALQSYATNFLDRYHKGEDISTLMPTSVENAQKSADAAKYTMQAASRQGDASQLPKDSGYQRKLEATTTARLGRALATINDNALHGEVDSNRDILMNTTNMLNADQQAGMGLYSQSFGMAQGVFNSATTRRQMEQARAAAMNNMLFQGISGGLQGLLGAFTGGMFSGGNSGGATAGTHSSGTFGGGGGGFHG